MTTFEYYLKSAKDFKGSKALFWAGRMSIVIENMGKCNIRHFAEELSLLYKCKEKYDEEVFKGVKK